MTEVVLPAPVAVIGPGRLGSALARAFFHRGAVIRAIVGPRLEKARRLAQEVACDTAVTSVAEIPADAGLLLICTPDDAIQVVAQELAVASLPFGGVFAAHFSGAKTSEVLAPLRQKGAQVAAIHPVQSFAGSDEDWQRLAGIYYGIEADEAVLARAGDLVRFLGGIPVTIPREGKAAYHLACTMASNFAVALFRVAADVLQEVGLAEREATRLLLPLVEGTLRNVRQLGVVGAITGPLARGDAGTVQAHLDILRQRHAELEKVYRALGRVAVSLGRQRGSFDEARLTGMQKLLEDDLE